MPAVTPTRDDLTADEAAAELRVKPLTVRAYCRTGRLPGAYRVGGQWRVPRASLGAVCDRPPGLDNAPTRPLAETFAWLRKEGFDV